MLIYKQSKNRFEVVRGKQMVRTGNIEFFYRAVASLADAWIEIVPMIITGLTMTGRIPRGCVD